jgi:hypothetical protein
MFPTLFQVSLSQTYKLPEIK